LPKDGARAEVEASERGSWEIAQLLLILVALVAYVYAIGWLVEWARLSAARLPLDSALPSIDDKVILATGARAVLAMIVVFAAMCAYAYAVHLFRWDERAEQWRAIVATSRARERKRQMKEGTIPAERLTPAGLAARVRYAAATRRRRRNKLRKARAALLLEAHMPPKKRLSRTIAAMSVAPEEALIRVIAGFNVGVIALALGLVMGRFAKTLIDQARPGHWWALLLPWAVFSVFFTWLLGKVNPLRGPPFVHALVWLVAVAIALVSSAPVGLLVLTWIAIGTLGRRYGNRMLPRTVLGFLRSPLPWALLTIYAFVALSYSAMPPVRFSAATAQTSEGGRLGGYLARTHAGLYFAACTPLADATSFHDSVEFVPAGSLRSLTTTQQEFALDSGSRPSLPALAFKALGIDAQPPAWIRPELKDRPAPCAGTPPPRPSGSSEAHALGGSVFAGSAPPGGRARDGEAPIELTSPQVAALARRYQPTVLVSVADRFWPVSVGAALEDRGSRGQFTCLSHTYGTCAISHPTLASLAPASSAPGDFLRYPVRPPLTSDPTAQFNAFLRGQTRMQKRAPALHEWLGDPGTLEAFASAQVYFYYAGEAQPAVWPARNAGIEHGLIALQYWFFYPYNYYPTLTNNALMNDAPVAADIANTDLHQGDWEHVTVLVDRHAHPRWVYMARHSDEGEYLPWNSPRLSFDERHVIVQAALGGHPTYPAGCGERLRFAHGLKGLVGDWLPCGPGRFAFRAASTPLVDLAKTGWACWKGRFGSASPLEVQNAKRDEGSVVRALERYVLVAGPRSPLWQAENGHLAADGAPARDAGPCASAAGAEASERAAIREGVPGAPPRARTHARARGHARAGTRARGTSSQTHNRARPTHARPKSTTATTTTTAAAAAAKHT
jgi:hypothetical protein